MGRFWFCCEKSQYQMVLSGLEPVSNPFFHFPEKATGRKVVSSGFPQVLFQMTSGSLSETTFA